MNNLAGIAAGTPNKLPMTYEYLPGTGLATGPDTTENVISKMENGHAVIFSVNHDRNSVLTDLPVSYGVCILAKGVMSSYLLGIASDIINGDTYVISRKTSGEISWRRVLTNVLSSDDYGTAFPANAVTGQVYYIKG